MKSFIVYFALLVFALAVSAISYSATIIYTNDVMGELEPCGCRSNPLGGMARKQNFLKTQSDPSLLILDAGDLLFQSDLMPDLLKKQSELQAHYLLRALEATHQDAVVPGEKEFALGFKEFEKLRKHTSVQFLAANLSRRDGKSFLKPDSIFIKKTEKGEKIKIGVFGLVSDELKWPKELQATSPISAAKAEVAVLKEKGAQLIIALTHQGLENDRKLATMAPGIDIIIGGHSQSFIQNPLKVRNTRIYQSSFRNQYVGVIPLPLPKSPKDDEQNAENRLTAMDAGLDSKSESPNEVDRIISDFKKDLEKLNLKEAEGFTRTPPQANGSLSKYQTFPKCSECHLKQFDFWRRTPHALSLASLVSKKQQSNKECQLCHTVGLGDPQGFSNLGEIAEVKKEGSAIVFPMDQLHEYLKKMHDASSLSDKIQISGFTQEPVHRLLALDVIVRSWAPVQCENCHNPGQDHPLSDGYKRTVEKTACLKCHTAERAPEWYTASGKPDWKVIDPKFASMTCPAGNLDVLEDDK